MKFFLKIIACVMAMMPCAFGFKVVTHVATANQALAEFQTAIQAGSPSSTIHFHGLDLHVTFAEAYQAVLNEPDYFRMGVLMPDAFPDLVSGQLALHPNQAMEHIPSEDVLNDVRYEQRQKPSHYRSIDFAMRFLSQARATGLQSDLSFALGYLGHVSGDGFAHAWVNQRANGYWDYFTGNGAYGPITEEIKHMALESFIDGKIPYNLVGTPPAPGGPRTYDKIALKAPYDLMDRYFREVMQGEPVGGPIYKYFSFQKEILTSIESGVNGPLTFLESVSGGPGTASSIRWLGSRIPALDALFDVVGFSPADDIANLFFDQFPSFNPASWYLGQIRENFDNLAASTDVFRRNWLVMSHCTMENIAKKEAEGIADRCPEFANDTYLTYPGTSGANQDLLRTEIEGLFQTNGRDHHKLGDNAIRAAEYLVAGFRVDNLGEVLVPADLRKAWADFRQWLLENDNVIVNAILYLPATAIAEVACIQNNLVCDAHCLINDCSTRILSCIPDRVADCFDCGSCSDFDIPCQIARGACLLAAPACASLAPVFCATEGVVGCVGCLTTCAYDNLITCTIDNILDFNSTQKLYTAVDEILAPIDAVKQYIADYIISIGCDIAQDAGVPIADIYRLVGIYKTIDALEEQGQFGFPNFAFLKEDLRDPAWLAKLAAGNNQLSQVLADLRDGNTTFIGDELSSLPVDVPDNCLSLDTEGAFYKDSKFGLIMSAAALFTEPGPSMTGVETEIGPNLPETFHPFFNTVQMIKLLPLQNAQDIEGLITQEGGDLFLLPWSSRGSSIYSTICQNPAQANLLCDVVPSLDNPDGVVTTGLTRDPAYLRRVTYNVAGQNVTWDWGRSVTPWNDYVPTDPDWTPHTLTSFPLSHTNANYDRLFVKIFRVPTAKPTFTDFDRPEDLWKAPPGVNVGIDSLIKTQGAGSMRISGSGYFVLESPRAKTTDFGVYSEKIAVDLWVPAGQPNPYWFGSVAMFMDITGAGIFNAWVGQVELTGLTTGAWNTIRFTLPENLVQALAGDYPGLVFKLAFNVNATAGPLRIDIFRFEPVLRTRTIFHQVGSNGINVSSKSLLRFETASDWNRGTLQVSRNTSFFTEGQASMAFVPQGWGTLVSRNFSSAEVAPASQRVSFDLRIPDPQPNIWWGGDISLTFNCPSAGLYNVYIGQQSLTNLFWGEFNDIGFNLPANVVQTLQQAGRTDCQWQIAVNVSSGSGTFHIDNFGFVNAMPLP